MAHNVKKSQKRDNFFPNSSDSFFITPSITGNAKVKKREEEEEKKPFNKKRWRLLKYSKRAKLEEWETRTNKAKMLRYQKEQKKDKDTKKFDVNKIYEEDGGEDENGDEEPQPKRRKGGYRSIQTQFRAGVEEKQRRKEEWLKVKAEKEKKLQEYKQRKAERFRKLNKKTRKGQPVMKERMEYLLEKIQDSIDK